MIIETDKFLNKIINKNVIKFDVKGALDFTSHLFIEMYGEEVVGAEEVPINDFLKKLNEVYPGLWSYFSKECTILNTEHHFNVRQRSIWVICKTYYRHSHEHWDSKGKTTILNNFDNVIELLSDEHQGYEIDFYGYSLDKHVEELEKYYGGDVERYVYVNTKTLRKKN